MNHWAQKMLSCIYTVSYTHLNRMTLNRYDSYYKQSLFLTMATAFAIFIIFENMSRGRTQVDKIKYRIVQQGWRSLYSLKFGLLISDDLQNSGAAEKFIDCYWINIHFVHELYEMNIRSEFIDSVTSSATAAYNIWTVPELWHYWSSG